MKVYKFPNQLTTTDDELTGYEAVWTLTDTQAELINAGGVLTYINGVVNIIPPPVVIAEEKKVILTKREFMSRLTPVEFGTIKAASEQSVQVAYFWQMFQISEEIDLSHPDTIEAITMMEQASLLAYGRALEILS